MAEQKNIFVGWVGPSNKLSAPRFDAQRAHNCFVETNPLGMGKEQQTGVLLSRPGLRPRASLFGGEIRGMHAVSNGGHQYAVAGSRVYASTDNFVTSTLIGIISTSSGPVSFADNGASNGAPTVIMVDGVAGYRWSEATPTDFAMITTTTDPGWRRASTITFQDRYFIANQVDTDSFFVSDVNAPTFSESTDAAKSGYGDKIVAVISNNRTLYLLGEKTLETWWNTGTSAVLPFTRIDGQFSNTGCAAGATVRKLADMFFWVGPNEQGGPIVYAMKGTPSRISNHAVELSLQSLTAEQLATATAWTYQENGHFFYLLCADGLDTTWVYDVSTNLWHERRSFDGQNGQTRHLADCGIFANGETLCGSHMNNENNGAIYVLDQTYRYDDTYPILWLRASPHLSSALNNQSVFMLQLDCQAGQADLTGTSAAIDPHLTLRVSKDGGQTWGLPKKAALGKTGRWQTRQRWHRLGYGRDFVFEVSCTDPVDVQVLSAWLVMDGGNS